MTDAERATGVYSNRFAGHILRQHQMMTLARLNHWNVTHRIWADVRNDEPTHLVIPAWNIVAELWTRGRGRRHAGSGRQRRPISSSRPTRCASTRSPESAKVSATALRAGARRGDAHGGGSGDRLLRGHAPLRPLHQRGERRQRPELDRCRRGRRASGPVAPRPWPRATGARRRSATSARARHRARKSLQELLPPLKIADRCSIDGNYLRVQGKLRALQDPLRLGQHPDGAGQPLPLHRQGERRRRAAASCCPSRAIRCFR